MLCRVSTFIVATAVTICLAWINRLAKENVRHVKEEHVQCARGKLRRCKSIERCEGDSHTEWNRRVRACQTAHTTLD